MNIHLVFYEYFVNLIFYFPIKGFNSLHAFCGSSADCFQNKRFFLKKKTIFQEHDQSVKQFGSRSGLAGFFVGFVDFCCVFFFVCFFFPFFSPQQKTLAGKDLGKELAIEKIPIFRSFLDMNIGIFFQLLIRPVVESHQ